MIIKRVCRATSCKRIIADSRVVRSRRIRRRVSPHSRSGCLMPRAVTTRIERAQTTRLRKNTVNYTQYTSCRAYVDTYTYILYNIYIIYWIGCPSNEKFTNSAYGGRAMRFAAYIVQKSSVKHFFYQRFVRKQKRKKILDPTKNVSVCVNDVQNRVFHFTEFSVFFQFWSRKTHSIGFRSVPVLDVTRKFLLEALFRFSFFGGRCGKGSNTS